MMLNFVPDPPRTCAHYGIDADELKRRIELEAEHERRMHVDGFDAREPKQANAAKVRDVR